MSIFEKIELIFKSNVEDALDRVIDMNSVGAVRQEARDLEGNLRELQTLLAEAIADQKGAQRAVATLQGREQELQGQINALLTDDDPSNDHFAQALVEQLVPVQDDLAPALAELETATKARSGIEQAVSQVEAKHNTMVQQLDRLEVQDRTADAKSRAATTLQKATRLAGSGRLVSVDNIGGRIQHKADVADAQFDQALSEVQDAPAQNANAARAAALLAQMKLAAKTAQTPVPAA